MTNLRDLWLQLQMEWEEAVWQSSPERLELAQKRLALHRKAMKEGLDSPYTNPEKYNFFD